MVRFTATVLLERPWRPDVGVLAAAVAERFPGIGRVEAVPGKEAPAVRIDGADVTLRPVDAPLPAERLVPRLRPLSAWDAGPAVRGHAAHLDISCGGPLPGLDGARAYAAVLHLVAATVAELAPAAAVFWREGWALAEPRTFAGAAGDILSGKMPLGAWVGFAMIVPKGYPPERATGMVTHGLRPFIGRELELAPRPGDARTAWRCVGRVARLALEGGITLADGQRLADPERTFAVTVRARGSWVRPDLPTFLLVGDDSIINATTLELREPAG